MTKTWGLEDELVLLNAIIETWKTWIEDEVEERAGIIDWEFVANEIQSKCSVTTLVRLFGDSSKIVWCANKDEVSNIIFLKYIGG